MGVWFLLYMQSSLFAHMTFPDFVFRCDVDEHKSNEFSPRRPKTPIPSDDEWLLDHTTSVSRPFPKPAIPPQDSVESKVRKRVKKRKRKNARSCHETKEIPSLTHMPLDVATDTLWKNELGLARDGLDRIDLTLAWPSSNHSSGYHSSIYFF